MSSVVYSKQGPPVANTAQTMFPVIESEDTNEEKTQIKCWLSLQKSRQMFKLQLYCSCKWSFWRHFQVYKNWFMKFFKNKSKDYEYTYFCRHNTRADGLLCSCCHSWSRSSYFSAIACKLVIADDQIMANQSRVVDQTQMLRMRFLLSHVWGF